MTKISDASLVAAATGLMKIPTGEVGDLAVNINQIRTYVLATTDPAYWKVTGTTTITGNVVVNGDDKTFELSAYTAGLVPPYTSLQISKNASLFYSENINGASARAMADQNSTRATASLYAYDPTSTNDIEFIIKSDNVAQIRSSIAGFKGIQEAADYSASYDLLSLPNKGHVISLIDAEAIETITAAQKYTVSALPDADYQLVLSDAVPVVKFLTLNSATPRTVTLPNNTSAAIPVGQGPIALLNLGSASITVVAEAGATVENYSTVFTIPPGSMATFMKRAINTWRLENITAAVPTSRTIAGIDLVDDITAAELNTALGGWTKVYLTNNRVFSSTSYADVTDLLAPNVANTPMEIMAVIFYETASASEGLKLDFNGGTLTSKFTEADIMSATTTLTSRCSGAYDTMTAAPNGIVSGSGGIARVYHMVVAASGNQQLRAGTETGGVNVTILGGTGASRKSYIQYRNV